MIDHRVKRIAIVGPECTGKTSLSKDLAAHFKTQWVAEYARQYLDQLHREYVQGDLVHIAKGQLSAEDDAARKANGILICDTNLIVIKIWSEFKYGNCDPEIITLLKSRHYDLHFLTDIDIPWENDPLREHPEKREELFTIYKKELETLNIPFVIVHGDPTTRKSGAIRSIHEILNIT